VLGCASASASESERGWAFLIEKLTRDGVPRDQVLRVFRDERCDPFDGLHFSLHPREPQSLYRNLRTRATAGRARNCLAKHREAFDAAEAQYGVSSNVVASIIQIESGCGANTGRARIVPALARLAMASEPSNVAENVRRLALFDTEGSVASFARWRAQALEDMFYPEVKAAFDIANRLGLDPLEMRGSGSGAFGIPQFLPRSYLWFAVDGNQDGQVSLYDAEDAIPSCARYLQHYGWKPGLSRTERKNVIWGYNHSDAYIDTVLWVASEVVSPTPEPPQRTRVAKRRRSRRPAPHTVSAKPTRATKAHAKSKSAGGKKSPSATKAPAGKTASAKTTTKQTKRSEPRRQPLRASARRRSRPCTPTRGGDRLAACRILRIAARERPAPTYVDLSFVRM
jgi:membrane-bound lytic murein transglycosylase B